MIWQLLSSVVKSFILYTYNPPVPVPYPYANGSAESVPGGEIITAGEHEITIVPLNVVVILWDDVIIY